MEVQKTLLEIFFLLFLASLGHWNHKDFHMIKQMSPPIKLNKFIFYIGRSDSHWTEVFTCSGTFKKQAHNFLPELYLKYFSNM